MPGEGPGAALRVDARARCRARASDAGILHRRGSVRDVALRTASTGPARWALSRLRLAVLAAVVIAVVSGAFLWNRPGATDQPAINSVAVLPFDNTAQDPDIEYIGDGLTDGLIDHLARAKSLTVRRAPP